MINLGLGSPVQAAPQRAIERFYQEMLRPGGLGYATSNGVQEAREAVCFWQQDVFGVEGLNPGKDYNGTPESCGNVTFAEGSRLLLVSAFEALFHPGDEVIMPSRFYNGHRDAAVKFLLQPVFVPMPSASAYVDGIEERLRSGWKPKAVITCFVSNPTGISCQKAVYERLVALAHKYGFLILDDYAYGALDYEQGYVPCVLAVPKALDVALWFGTASKMFSAASWKVGFAVGRQDRIAILTRAKSIYSEGGSIPGQLATATALRECRADVIRVRKHYRIQAELTTNLVREAGLKNALMPEGGMFGWFPVDNYYGGSVRLVAELYKCGIILRDDLLYGGCGQHIRWCLRVSEAETRTAGSQLTEVLTAG